MTTINLLAVFVSALVSMIIGSIWYGLLFGKKFMHEMCMDSLSPEKQAEMKKKMGASYALQFVASLVMFYVLAGIVTTYGVMTVSHAMGAAFWMWIGFVVPVKLSEAIWGGKASLFWINIGNMLMTLLAAGAIIGAWR